MLPFFPPFIPNLLQIAPFILAFAILCANPLRKHPGWFYALWTVAVVAVTWADPVASIMQESTPVFVSNWSAIIDSLGTTMPALDAVVQLLTSSFTGVCFYLIVMFVGALDKTPVVKKLLSIRSELSVIGGIVVMGHVVRIIDFPFLFLNPMWSQIWGTPAVDFMFVAAVVVGVPLTLTFLVPWITSFRVVRNHMSHAAWKKTQVLAYPFMALMVMQGFLLAVGHALYGYPFDGTQVVMSIMSNPSGWLGSFAQQVATAWMYLVLGAGYLVLRLRKRSRDKLRKEESRMQAAQAQSSPAQDAQAQQQDVQEQRQGTQAQQAAASIPALPQDPPSTSAQ